MLSRSSGTRRLLMVPLQRHPNQCPDKHLRPPTARSDIVAFILPSPSISPIARGPPERLAHLVVDDAGIDAEVARRPLVALRELAASHVAAAPLAQRRDDQAQDQAPARARCHYRCKA